MSLPSLFLALALVFPGTDGESESLRRLYKELLTGVEPQDTLRHFQIGHWCLEKGLYPEMFEQFDRVLRQEPRHDRIPQLLRKVQGQALTSRLSRKAPELDRAKEWISVAAGKSPAKALLARWEIESLPPETRTQALLSALKSSRVEWRRFAVAELGQEPTDPALIGLLGATLRDIDPEVRQTAASSLQAMDRKESAIPIIQALSNAQPAVRIHAAEALAVIREPKAAPYLIEALRQASGGESAAGPRAYVFFGTQTAYVRDFDVQIAQAAVIADPVVGILQSGSVLDVRILGVSGEITVSLERRVIRDALVKISGVDCGDQPQKWESWWRSRSAAATSTGSPK